MVSDPFLAKALALLALGVIGISFGGILLVKFITGASTATQLLTPVVYTYAGILAGATLVMAGFVLVRVRSGEGS